MSLLTGAPARRRPDFLPLRISDVHRLTDQAVVLTFDVPAPWRSRFDFEPGQYLTLRAEVDGVLVRRSYSICSSPQEYATTGQLRVASARVSNGAMSGWLNDGARVGEDVDVMTPLGDFAAAVFAADGPADRPPARHLVAVAAGSGITPIMSVVGAALHQEPSSRVSVVFGNRDAASVMFRDELAAWERQHPDRFRVHHILSRQPEGEGHLSGRIDRHRMNSLIRATVPVAEVDEWFVCGPHPMVTGVLAVLDEAGAQDAHVHHEVFHVESDSPGV